MRLWFTAIFAVGCAAKTAGVMAPMADIRPKELRMHDDVRIDNYYWLNQREDPDVLAYLKAENAFTEAHMASTGALQQTLFEEFKARIPQTNEQVPFPDGDWLYSWRVEEGKDYGILSRRPRDGGDEQLVLDINALAEDHDGYFQVAGVTVSPDHRRVAYAVDTVGRRIYTLNVLDLETGETLPDTVPGITSNLVWANDNATLFYTWQDPETLRWSQVRRHRLGADVADDVVVHDETDDTYWCGVGRMRSGAYLEIACDQTLASEVRVLPADEPEGTWQVVAPRERGREYSLTHHGDDFYIVTNDAAKNFRLMKTPTQQPGREHWTEVVAHREDVLLTGVTAFARHLVLFEREGGLRQMRVMDLESGELRPIDFGEAAYVAYGSTNRIFDTGVFRYAYQSPTTPPSVYEVDFDTGERTLLKQDEMGAGFAPENYVTERFRVEARDGAQVPVTVVYRKGLTMDGSNPLLVNGYGSYGYSQDPSFSGTRISLLDRGVIVAIAHVRGGSELGRSWYEDGRQLKKMNTFTDFIDVGQALVDRGYTSPDRMGCEGGSAGGLLIGAVVNLAPELFSAAHAAVPFVDVVTTMTDPSIPLTTGEYDEWGDPRDPVYYDYIKSYSPYDNVGEHDYPALLVTAGLHDSQVQYFEPAKWVAKLRATKTGQDVLLLKTEMEAGHSGAAARDTSYRETAFEYAFFLDQFQIRE
ncbi:MAG: S9 family peptidase [Myxococcota bacterium]